ncbi:MAG: NAD(P)/FAD-dependent oxidoreductase, partial [Rhodospirillales bacterium]|nr:NAD(P)/FAD-dependent oxidoreductase [Rhodospirillales bacterium]
MPDTFTRPKKTVAVIGAGPVGLAAAAHLLERGLEPVVIEAGPTVGHAVRQWSHVQTFSPWEYNIDKAADRLLTAAGWNRPQPDHYPTGAELVEQYLEPLATRTPLADRIRTSSRVTAIGRAGFDKVKTKGRDSAPFEIRYDNGKGPGRLTADAVIDASGTWFSPNPAGANGLRAVGESEAQDRIAYGMPDVLGRDRARYAGRSVAVLGGGGLAAHKMGLTESVFGKPDVTEVIVELGKPVTHPLPEIRTDLKRIGRKAHFIKINLIVQ